MQSIMYKRNGAGYFNNSDNRFNVVVVIVAMCISFNFETFNRIAVFYSTCKQN